MGGSGVERVGGAGEGMGDCEARVTAESTPGVDREDNGAVEGRAAARAGVSRESVPCELGGIVEVGLGDGVVPAVAAWVAPWAPADAVPGALAGAPDIVAFTERPDPSVAVAESEGVLAPAGVWTAAGFF
jgi:hypothetical protein